MFASGYSGDENCALGGELVIEEAPDDPPHKRSKHHVRIYYIIIIKNRTYLCVRYRGSARVLTARRTGASRQPTVLPLVETSQTAASRHQPSP
ncbi:unnamed protein product [Danaus chrysippus]|uniref:(African queen) hypothetical protein n=1 Tax=Danaus chrysippus TaxID=151541 RepID=A0A8J2RCB5_9NEOP|nr:unnamed protein product [Danaus chrysippus]